MDTDSKKATKPKMGTPLANNEMGKNMIRHGSTTKNTPNMANSTSIATGPTTNHGPNNN